MKLNGLEDREEDILIVDDTAANLRLLSQMLVEQGYHVRPILDSSLVFAAVQAEMPDLIMLDIRMPGMNGYEVCQKLKENGQTSDIPIIFISAMDATQDKLKAFTVGGVDYITKPFQVEEVLARVSTHLALRKLQKQLQDANRKMARELATAGKVQVSFLPHVVPKLQGWQLSATLQPAWEMSGDFYDFISLSKDNLGIVVADVSDKGAGAALYMALSCTLIRTYAIEYPSQPEMVLGMVNQRMLQDTESSHFVTAFYGVLDLIKGSLIFCNAGHCPPLLINQQKGSNIQSLTSTGIPLGIFEDQVWQQGCAQLLSGDKLILYTDGITEAQNTHGALFGKDQLLESVRGNIDAPAREIQDAILDKVKRFVGDTPIADDIALVILQRE